MKNERKKKSNMPKAREKSSKGSAAVSALIGSAFGICVCMILTLILAFALSKLKDPSFPIPAAAVVCTVASSMVAGFVCARRRGGFDVLPCLLAGLIMAAVCFAVSLFFDQSKVDSDIVYKCLIVLSFPAFSLLGGRMAKNSGKKAKKRIRT